MLFDTDVLIWALHGSAKAAKEVDEDDNRFISAVNYMELIQGARNKREQTLIKQFLNALDFTVLPITEAVSHRAMILIEEYALKSGIQLTDALVFATLAHAVQREPEAFPRHCFPRRQGVCPR